MSCWLCNDTGVFEDPIDKEMYDRMFDMYDKPGTISMGECRKKALKDSGYKIMPCTECSKGKYLCAIIEYRKNTVDLIKAVNKLINSLSTLNVPDAQSKIFEANSWLDNFNRVLKETDDEMYKTFEYRIDKD